MSRTREEGPAAGGTAVGARSATVRSLKRSLASGARSAAVFRLTRAEERRLVDERRSLELQEAQLLSPERLERYAKERDLAAPAPNQMVRLDGASDGAVAMVKK